MARAEDDEDNGGKPKKPPPEFEYVELKPLTLPIINSNGLTQQVSLLVSLEVPYGKTDEIKAAAPKLADAYISDLYGALGSGSAMLKGGIIDVNAVKEHLTADTTKVLGPDKVHAVLLDVMQQSRR
jgi:hypothetical protein